MREASLEVVQGRSVVAPLIIEGLPEEIVALGSRWQRKREFHVTVVPRSILEAVGGGRPDLWDLATRVLSGRELGPVTTTDDVRRVIRPADDPRGELQTLIVMVDAPGMGQIYNDLSAAPKGDSMAGACGSTARARASSSSPTTASLRRSSPTGVRSRCSRPSSPPRSRSS